MIVQNPVEILGFSGSYGKEFPFITFSVHRNTNSHI